MPRNPCKGHEWHVAARAAVKAKNRADLEAALCLIDREGLSLRAAAKEYRVSKTQLQRLAAGNLESDGRRVGRRPRLTTAEEGLIADACREFSRNGTPLSRRCLMQLVKTFIDELPTKRQREIGFNGNTPGLDWIRGFLSRNSNLTLQRSTSLGACRADAMSPENLAAHFCRLNASYQKYRISSPSLIFNLDESGFSMRGMSKGRRKVITTKAERGNVRDLKFSGNTSHVTLMAVVSGDGKAWNPVVVLPGKRTRWRKRMDGTVETPTDFLPYGAYVFHRDNASVDKDIFFEWSKMFISETSFLGAGGRFLVLIVDGFSGHIQYRTLQYLKDNNCIVIALPAHRTHRTQVLDCSCFGPLKAAYRNILGRRAVTTTPGDRNDIFTICEMLKEAYYTALTPRNISKGFLKCGIWSERNKGADPYVIQESDFSNFTADETHKTPLESYQDLLKHFKSRSRQLTSDGVVESSGTITTKSGATLTSQNVLHCLKIREEKKAEDQRKREERKKKAEERKRERKEKKKDKEPRKKRKARDIAEVEGTKHAEPQGPPQEPMSFQADNQGRK